MIAVIMRTVDEACERIKSSSDGGALKTVILARQGTPRWITLHRSIQRNNQLGKQLMSPLVSEVDILEILCRSSNFVYIICCRLKNCIVM